MGNLGVDVFGGYEFLRGMGLDFVEWFFTNLTVSGLLMS